MTTETLTELVARWRKTLAAYGHLFNTADENKKMVVSIAGQQLSKCIDELETVMYGDPLRTQIAQMISNIKEADAHSARRPDPGDSASVESGDQG